MGEQIFTTLRLQNFRSYKDFAVELAPAVNIVVGPNASGKTNLLEALLVLCGQTSYRAGFGELITHHKQWARIDGNTASGSRVVKLMNPGGIMERTYEINEKVKKRLNFNDKLPVILFEPEHMRLLTGSPQLRRDFLDDILIATQPDFNNLSQKYRRALIQRNCLLKNHHQSNHQQIFAWNVRLSELAGQIVSARVNLIAKLNKNFSAVYSQIAKTKTAVDIQYISDLPIKTYESALLHKLETNLNNDLARGFTAFGPHREDIAIFINRQPAEVVASRGETRTIVITLKLLELDLLEQARDQKPLVLLDDVFSELDGARRHTLTQRLQGYQTIITTTDADMVQKSFMQKVNITSLR